MRSEEEHVVRKVPRTVIGGKRKRGDQTGGGRTLVRDMRTAGGRADEATDRATWGRFYHLQMTGGASGKERM